ncbi:hypothetical protein GCM10010915_13360 [Microbacterium faecale]|uniref:DUF2249 domain-containing protein n=1 Tax=Microbacterium faecale TaxID=1804630 RepID=A0A916Y874_9MICO|nr:DUF2249 domain-containing protein [Microbacterium faecale]GGD34299.1 hypothetical protein GCM10010915_13360 [Microbacterium faecale]
MESQILDVRSVSKTERHPRIFAAYDALAAAESFVLVNDHDPKHLRDEFDREHPGSFSWDYENRDDGDWRVRISKLTSTALPRIVGDSAAEGSSGAVWNLAARDRTLDANVISLPAGDGIAEHVGPDLDVLVHVVSGSGTLVTERGDVALVPGALVWLPKRSRRAFAAGSDGLRYLTVHQRKKMLGLSPRPAGAAR